MMIHDDPRRSTTIDEGAVALATADGTRQNARHQSPKNEK
jgi:hypothetical protein